MAFRRGVLVDEVTQTINPSVLPAYLQQSAIEEIAASAGSGVAGVLDAGEPVPAGTPVGTIFFVRSA